MNSKVALHDRRALSHRATVIERVEEGWFPPQHGTLCSVRRYFTQPAAERNRARLIDDVQMDPALLLRCLKALPSAAGSNFDPADPLAALATLEEEKLKSILPVNERAVSDHRLRSSTRFQAVQYEEMVLTGVASREFASHAEVSPSQALIAATVRQLALSLIAWNFPHIFTKAMFKYRKEGTDLHDTLATHLGVHPIELCSHFAKQCQLSDSIQNAITSSRTSGLVKGSQNSSLLLICEASELFAQSKHPTAHPLAGQRWEERRAELPFPIDEEIEQKVIVETVQLMQHIAAGAAEAMVTPLLSEVSPLLGGFPRAIAVLTEHNRWLRSLAPELEALAVSIYRHIRPGEVSIDAVRILVDAFIPACHFREGCLYLLDRSGALLIPSLRCGEQPLGSFQPVAVQSQHIISDALFLSAPFSRQGGGLMKTSLRFYAGSVPSSKHTGVLYLELEQQQEAEAISSLPLDAFQATRQMLADALDGWVP